MLIGCVFCLDYSLEVITAAAPLYANRKLISRYMLHVVPYCMSKKHCPISYSKLLYKMDHFFLGIQNVLYHFYMVGPYETMYGTFCGIIDNLNCVNRRRGRSTILLG